MLVNPFADLDSAFSPDGNYFAVGQVSNDGNTYYINIYNVADWTIAHKIITEDYIYSVDFSPDGKMLVSGSRTGIGKLWNVSDGSQIKSFSASGPIRFSPDGSAIVFGYMDKLVHLWNIQDEKNIFDPIHLPLFAWDKLFSPDGKYIFVTTIGAYVRIFDSLTGKFITMLDTKSPRGVSAMAISPNGKLLITAGLDNNQLNWWNTGTWSSMFTEKGHGQFITGLAFSPDGSLLVSGNDNGTIEFWDPTNGEHLSTIQAVNDWASVKSFSEGRSINGDRIRRWSPPWGWVIMRLERTGITILELLNLIKQLPLLHPHPQLLLHLFPLGRYCLNRRYTTILRVRASIHRSGNQLIPAARANFPIY